MQLYAHVDSVSSPTTIIETGTPQQLDKITGFPANGPDAEYCASHNWIEITWPNYDSSTQTIVSCAPYISGAAVYNAIAENLTPAQLAPIQYAAAIAAGLSITSTGTSAANNTYAIDAQTCIAIDEEVTYIDTNGTFTANASSVPMFTPAGVLAYEFTTTALYEEFATAIADYVFKCDSALQDQETTNTDQTWPTASVTIA